MRYIRGLRAKVRGEGGGEREEEGAADLAPAIENGTVLHIRLTRFLSATFQRIIDRVKSQATDELRR
jgi:hypothetical protein